MAVKRNMLYVGGLDAEVTEDILFAAFIPFGPLRSVQIPKDFKESM
jgi:RNA recognition motif-containing protein